jgi:hypothetical protein
MHHSKIREYICKLVAFILKYDVTRSKLECIGIQHSRDVTVCGGFVIGY